MPNTRCGARPIPGTTTTTKNKRTHPDKMEVSKYDPVVRKHVPYKEAKIK